MTSEKAIDILDDNFTVIDTHGHFSDEEVEEARQMAIKALENQCPSKGVDCEDCPANEPKAKVGKWIPTYGNVKCSVCGNVKDSRNVGKATHYCDFCGAKIESEDKK